MSIANEKPSVNAHPAAEDLKPSRPNHQFKARLWVALLIIAVSTIAAVPFFFMGHAEDGRGRFALRMPATHDMFLHYDQMKSFYEGLSAGLWYPRWEADTNRGYGAPTTSYYPPGVYYLTSAIYAVTHDWTWTLLVLHWLLVGLSGWAMYGYARGALSRGGSVVAAVAYVAGPYHLLDEYQRGAIAELLGFVWMPLMLWGGERLLKAKGERQKGNEGSQPGGRQASEEVVGDGARAGGMKAGGGGREPEGSRWREEAWAMGVLAVSYGGYVWGHPPTAYQFSLGFGVYVMVMGVMGRAWKGLVKVGVGLGLGMGLAAAYIVPAAVEQNLIHKEYITSSWPYHNTYVFVHDLFNANVFVDFFHRLNALWVIGCVMIVLAAVMLGVFGKQLDATLRQRLLLWTVLGGFVTFMMHKVSKPIGELIPKIDIGVFSWRMLSIMTLVLALLAGACFEIVRQATQEQQKKLRLAFAGFGGLILLSAVTFSALFVVAPVWGAPVFVPEEAHFNAATIPATALGVPEEYPDDSPLAELATEDNGEVEIVTWTPEHRVIRVRLDEADQLWVRTCNFPGWTATVDGAPKEIITGEDLGDIELNLDAGAHEIKLDFLDTPIRRKCGQVTLAAFGLVALLALAPLVVRPRKRKSPQ